MRISWGVVIALSLGPACAQAQTAQPASPLAEKPKAVAPAAPAAPKPAETTAAAPPQEEIRSESKFLAVLYAEIAKQSASEEEKELGEGQASASFHVDANGKIDKVTIDNTTSEAHSAAVKRILAQVKVPRPPNGGMDIGQTFKFH
ncbi:TonB C-terminal domain-containing protein [Methylocystis bryophila]|nr:TonB C-terminal domain-containing protein [Methylocystis bryophila]